LIPREYPFEPPKMKFETKMWVFEVMIEVLLAS
jgi:ubiquitin-protein ligase